MSVTMRELLPQVTVAERPLPGFGGEVRAVYIEGARHRVLVDTLLAPTDVAAFRNATLVVNTHADWDHVWGNPAFAGRVPILGHRRCRERLLRDDGALLREFQARDPATYAGAGVVPPDLAFEGVQVIDAGGLTLELHPLPGHTADSVAVYIPERRLLLAADCAELPVPSLEVPGMALAWARQLRGWAGRDVQAVVPAHGPPGGPELLRHNADYIEALFHRVELALNAGRDAAEIEVFLPLQAFVPNAEQYDSYYRTVHCTNLQTVLAELAAAHERA